MTLLLALLFSSDATFRHLPRAKETIRLACATLASEGRACAPVVLALKEDEEAPPRRVDAHTAIVGGACVVTLTPRALRDPRVIAHEACHCALDRQDIGPRGWTIANRDEIAAREERARACAVRLQP